jgi:hypothetical protein
MNIAFICIITQVFAIKRGKKFIKVNLNIIGSGHFFLLFNPSSNSAVNNLSAGRVRFGITYSSSITKHGNIL